MEIKIIPYEDRKKQCTHFNPAHTTWTDDQIKLHIIEIAANQTEKYEDITQLFKILDTFDITSFRNNKTVIQFGDMWFEC